MYIKCFPRRALVEHLADFVIEAVRGAEKGLLIEVTGKLKFFINFLQNTKLKKFRSI